MKDLKDISNLMKDNINSFEDLKQKNILREFNYKSYNERVAESLYDLSEIRDNEMSDFFYEDIFNMPHYVSPRDFKDGVLFDVGTIYQIGMLDKYLGDIPLKNQKEIIDKYEALKRNPMITGLMDSLAILAPKNNFEGTNNMSGIDPVVYAIFKVGNSQKLIKLTEWL